MAKTIWTEPALDDLQDIVAHIARDSTAYAERFGLRIVEAPRRLEQFPHVGRMMPVFQDPNIRELICGGYRIVYQIRGDVCYIVAVIHGSRDFTRHVKPGEWEIT